MGLSHPLWLWQAPPSWQKQPFKTWLRAAGCRGADKGPQGSPLLGLVPALGPASQSTASQHRQQCLSQRARYTEPLKLSDNPNVSPKLPTEPQWGLWGQAVLCCRPDSSGMDTRRFTTVKPHCFSFSCPVNDIQWLWHGTRVLSIPPAPAPHPLSTRASFSLCWPVVFPSQGLQRDRVGAEKTGPEYPRGSTNKGPQPNSNSI